MWPSNSWSRDHFDIQSIRDRAGVHSGLFPSIAPWNDGGSGERREDSAILPSFLPPPAVSAVSAAYMPCIVKVATRGRTPRCTPLADIRPGLGLDA